jgi:hypothetical protein
MSEFINNNLTREKRIELMKKLLIDMDKGLITPEEIKERFKEVLANVHPVEIAIIENALIVNEHFPQEKIQNLCGVHIDIFKDVSRKIKFYFLLQLRSLRRKNGARFLKIWTKSDTQVLLQKKRKCIKAM